MEVKSVRTLWLINPEEYVHGDNASVHLVEEGVNMTNQGWLSLGDKELLVEYDLPSRDEVRGKSVEQLRQMIRDVDAKGQMVKNQLEQKIQNLLAIGHTPATPMPSIDDIPF